MGLWFLSLSQFCWPTLLMVQKCLLVLDTVKSTHFYTSKNKMSSMTNGMVGIKKRNLHVFCTVQLHIHPVATEWAQEHKDLGTISRLVWICFYTAVLKKCLISLNFSPSSTLYYKTAGFVHRWSTITYTWPIGIESEAANASTRPLSIGAAAPPMTLYQPTLKKYL